MALQKFGNALMEHVVNDAKTPLGNVMTNFTEYTNAQQEKADLSLEKDTEYMEKHDNPRKALHAAYQQYVSQQTEAYLRYESTPSGTPEKTAALQEFVRIRPTPELLQQGVDHDFVYSKFRANLTKLRS